MTENYKPFSIYDDDGEKKPPRKPFLDAGDDSPSLDLEIEESSSTEDESTRRQLMEQLGQDGPGGTRAPAPPPAEKAAPSPVEEPAPFLHGRSEGTAEERTRRVIRDRRAKGKIHDRRTTASIFDRPVEAERPLRPGRPSWHPFGHRSTAFWFLFPAFVVFTLCYLYPTLLGFKISLTHYDPLGRSTPVGFTNYARALDDPLFWQTVVNATAFTLLSLVLGFWPPILLAVLLNEVTRGRGIFKVLYLVPFILPVIPAANLWKWIFDPGYGVANTALGLLLGIPRPEIGWLMDPRLALVSIVLVFVWKNTGWFMLIYFASLQNLPEQVYEAAELDGAGVLKRFLNVTLPWLRPIMGILLIIQVLITFQIFTEVYVMTNGAPMHATEVLGTYIYKTAFGALDLGYASAMAMLMFLVLSVFSIIRLAQIRRAGN